MENFRTFIIYFGSLFTLASGIAWILPLAVAGQKESQPKKIDFAYSLIDLLLILFDFIPIFWIFRAIPEVPSAYRAARLAWRDESSIRIMFWFSLGSLVVTVSAIFI